MEGCVASCPWLTEEIVRVLVLTFVMGVTRSEMNEIKTSCLLASSSGSTRVTLTSSIDDRAENTIARG